MKVCLNSHCSPEYLEKADEIKISYKDRNKIIDYVEKYPKATIILSLRDASEDIETTWEEIKRYQTLCKGKFLFAAVNANQVKECSFQLINFYLDRPIKTFEEVYWLKAFNSKYILVDSPLFYRLADLKDLGGISLRIAPNVAYYANDVPRSNGIYGSWIRPEDIELYSDYIDTIEFEDCDVRKEEALYRVYIETKKWPMDLNKLITNLDTPINNFYIPDTFGLMRLTCGQTCMSGGACHWCDRVIALANNKDFQERLKMTNDN